MLLTWELAGDDGGSETATDGHAGHLDIAAALLDHSPAQVNSRCEGSLPLHMVACLSALPARQQFSVEAAKLLVQHGASPFDRFGMPALHMLGILKSYPGHT